MDGAPYPAVVRLGIYAGQYWDIIDAEWADAHDAESSPLHLRPDRFLNYVYVWCAKRTPSEQLEQWEYELVAPLPWEQKKEIAPAAVEMEREAFDAFYAQVTGAKSG